MPGVSGKGLTVVVSGDVTMDWNLARVRGPQGPGEGWNAEDSVRVEVQPGGAALVARLVEEIAARLGEDPGLRIRVDPVGIPAGIPRPGEQGSNNSYALWSRMEGSAWRVEEFLGLERGPSPPGTGGEPSGGSTEADVVILDDADLGFRDRADLWPAALDGGDPRWVLLKIARPIGRGALWQRLIRRPERLIVAMTIQDLRLSEVSITRELSWERIAQDLVWELMHNPAVNMLSRCAHVVVSLGTGGALLLSAGDAGPKAFLFFDPEAIEDSWTRQHPGGMVGYTSTLVAGISAAAMRDPDAPDVHRGVQRGLAAMRRLHLEGYEDRDPAGLAARLAFPVVSVAGELLGDGEPFAVAEVPDPAGRLTRPPEPATEEASWTILRDRYPGGLDDLALRTLSDGPEFAISGVPSGRFGKLLTVDRREIEGFRSVGSLIREYGRQRRPRRPLSVAVFGPPGSGKSFAVIQVAVSALPGRVEALEFNLSQMNGQRDLIHALHRVRDAALAGTLPLVFWDEFDAALDGQALGWLRHFLAPMQDGAFQDEQLVHPVGPAVFVFAGGTSERMEAFGSPVTDAFRAAKGPDFVSRLKGYVNILGPDPRGGDAVSDPYFVLRRAILLRSMLLRDAPHLFRERDGRKVLQIDPGVARAFLHAKRFRHGARSMESVVAMSTVAGMTRFERSCLPSEAQLELHAEARDFLALVQRLDLEGDTLERLAEAAHVVYCAGMLEQGHAWGEEDRAYLGRHDPLAPFAARDGGGDPHPSLVAYEHLPERLKAQNRDLVRDIPHKLAAIGLVMRPARDNEPPAKLTEDEVERLAEQEHDRWVRSRLEAGWRYGSERDEARLLHPTLVAWGKLSDEEVRSRYGAGNADAIGPDELPEHQREKDRDQVRGMPSVLAVAGYAIVPAADPR